MMKSFVLRQQRHCYRRHRGSLSLRVPSRSQLPFSTTTPTPTLQRTEDDRLLIIGTGVAGTTTALWAATHYQIPVTLVCAGAAPTDCNSYWAQGGIIYQGDKSVDSPELLASDIHRAGAGLCFDPAVQKVAHEGPERVRQVLLNTDSNFAHVPFDRSKERPDELAVCLEASHAAARILHTADHTGKTITEHLIQAAHRHPLVTFQSNTVVTDLLLDPDNNEVCMGVMTQEGTTPLYGKYGTVLAAGGVAGIYEHTTNPSGFNALGSAVAMMFRATAGEQKDVVADLEYIQFHPTALHLPDQPRFLLTEALRGEGAILRNRQGHAFAKDYDPAGELAPRDIVARAVFMESQKEPDNVFLDITHREASWLYERFPTIHAYLQKHTSLDMAHDPLPVIPAAHYTCGGVVTDLQGATAIPHCYAAGEAARTGLHGGNRLASTSLLEGLVFGAAVADHVGQQGQALHDKVERAIQKHKAANSSSSVTKRHPSHSSFAPHRRNDPAASVLAQVRAIMWDHVGVCRNERGLVTAIAALEDCQESAAYYHAMAPSRSTAAARDASTAGLAVAKAAWANRTSAGAHYYEQQQRLEEDDDEEEYLVAASR